MIAESTLRKIPLFEDLEADELEKLASVMKERRAPKGSYIVYAQDPGPSMMFIEEGTVKVSLVSKEGKEIVLATLSEGEFFGEIALLTGEDRSANIIATTDCKLLVLDKEDFTKHIHLGNRFSLVLMRELALRLRAATSKIGDLALFDVYRRTARTLKSMAEVREVDGKEVHMIDSRPTHQELASMVGTSREMVTRALKGLEEDGCIVMEGKQIEIIRLPH